MRDYSSLIKYIESVKNKPHKWGKHDCCAFLKNCKMALTGNNYMPGFVGEYHDMESAIAIIRSTKSKTLYHNLINIFGKPIHISKAMRGDVVYKNDGLEGPSIGMCWGNITYFVGKFGLVEVNTLDCRLAWAK